MVLWSFLLSRRFAKERLRGVSKQSWHMSMWKDTYGVVDAFPLRGGEEVNQPTASRVS